MLESARSSSTFFPGAAIQSQPLSSDRWQYEQIGCTGIWRAGHGARGSLTSHGGVADAQDIAQEVFLRCWRAQQGLSEIRDLRAWIFRVGLNAAKDLQRSSWRRRVKPLLGENIMQLADGAAPPQIVEDEESLRRIRRALLDLRPEEKEVFLLRQNGDLTYEQIAQMRQCPIGTVKTQMRSALEKLRKILA